MTERKSMAMLAIFAAAAMSMLCACEKTVKKASAGGGASNQSLVTLQGASR